MATNKKRVTGYIGPELESDWKAYVDHLGVSESAALEWAIRAEIRRFKGENTKERLLEKIVEMLRHQGAQVDMLHTERWTQIAAPDGRVQVQIKLDDSDMERVLMAIRAGGQA